ncbi:ATP-binding protein [Streptomyces longwoodensis]|uniref:ATP-binding protein n=1 Tax=Streptomyces longwoodensis TaxID=68231 RepID=UPI00224FA442|nr:ATP-binding protein [Streptomyces longwoodensis]MCX5000767.1 ATP-binding protein [Streptomyces longwoodensis]
MTTPRTAPDPPQAPTPPAAKRSAGEATSCTAAWETTRPRCTVRIRSEDAGTVDLDDHDTGRPPGAAHAQPAHPASESTHTAPTTLKDTPVTGTDTTQTTPRPDQDDVVGEPDFYLNLADARIVATEALLEASENIADTIEARAMSCIYGDAGLGKTFSVLAALKEISAERVLLLQFRSRPTPRDIRQELFTELRLEGEPPSHPSEFDRLLKRTLARKPYVLVCDEAQQFSRECFEFVRHLWDTGQGKNRPAVLFVGGEEAYKTLYSEPSLASRIYIWQEFAPMEAGEVQRNIPLFHPVWANASPELIDYVYEEGAGGTFRVWSKITYHVLEGMKRRGLEQVDESIARWAIRRALPHRRRSRRPQQDAG